MEVNLVTAWIGVLLGVAFGIALGVVFHSDHRLRSLDHFKRRLLWLTEVSFFGLAIVNFAIFYTFQLLPPGSVLLLVASSVFVASAITMPVCFLITAYFPNARELLILPVLSLAAGSALSALEVAL